MGVFLWMVGVCVYICVYDWGGWCVLEGWKCIGKRGRRETTSFYHKLISS